jgi:hypothetical protein
LELGSIFELPGVSREIASHDTPPFTCLTILEKVMVGTFYGKKKAVGDLHQVQRSAEVILDRVGLALKKNIEFPTRGRNPKLTKVCNSKEKEGRRR